MAPSRAALEAVVMFTDLRGFTAMSERLPLFFDGSMDAQTLIDEVIFIVEDEIAFDS